MVRLSRTAAHSLLSALALLSGCRSVTLTARDVDLPVLVGPVVPTSSVATRATWVTQTARSEYSISSDGGRSTYGDYRPPKTHESEHQDEPAVFDQAIAAARGTGTDGFAVARSIRVSSLFLYLAYGWYEAAAVALDAVVVHPIGGAP